MMPFVHPHWVKFAIENVEQPLVKVGEAIFSKLPVPTKENTYKTDVHILIDFRDWFFSHRKRDSRYNALLGLVNYAITKFNRDDYYFDILKIFLHWIKKTNWEGTLSKNLKDHHWNKEGIDASSDIL